MKAKSLIKRFKNDPHGLLATLLAELVFANISLQDAKAIKQYLRAQVKELENKPTLQAEVDELLDNIAWYFENTETQPAPPPVRSAPVVLAAPLVPAKEGEATELIEPRNTLPVIELSVSRSETKLATNIYQRANSLADKSERQARLDFLHQLENKHYRAKKVPFFNPNPKWQTNFNPKQIRNLNRLEQLEEEIETTASKNQRNEEPYLGDVERASLLPKNSVRFGKVFLTPFAKDGDLSKEWMDFVQENLTKDPSFTAFLKYNFNQRLLHLGYNLAILDTQPLLRVYPVELATKRGGQPVESYVVTQPNPNTLRFNCRLALHDASTKQKILTTYTTIEVTKLSAEHAPHYEVKMTNINVRAYSSRAKLLAPNAYNRYRLEKYLNAMRVAKSSKSSLSAQQITAEAKHAIRAILEPYADFIHPYKFKQIAKIVINEAQRGIVSDEAIAVRIEKKAKQAIAQHVQIFLKSQIPSGAADLIFTEELTDSLAKNPPARAQRLHDVKASRLFGKDYENLKDFYLAKLPLYEKSAMERLFDLYLSDAGKKWLALDEMNDLIALELLGDEHRGKSYEQRFRAHQERAEEKRVKAEASFLKALTRDLGREEKSLLNDLINEFTETDFFNHAFTADVMKELLLPQLAMQSIFTFHLIRKHGLSPDKAQARAKELSIALSAGINIATQDAIPNTLSITNLWQLLRQGSTPLVVTLCAIADADMQNNESLDSIVKKTVINQVLLKAQNDYKQSQTNRASRNLALSETTNTAFANTVGAYLTQNPTHFSTLETHLYAGLAKTPFNALRINQIKEACSNLIANENDLLLAHLVREALAPEILSEAALNSTLAILKAMSTRVFRVPGWPANQAHLKSIVTTLFKTDLMKNELTPDEIHFIRSSVYQIVLKDLLLTDLDEFKAQGGRRLNNNLSANYQQLVMEELSKDPNALSTIVKSLADRLASKENWFEFTQLRGQLNKYIIDERFTFTKHYRQETDTQIKQSWNVPLPFKPQQVALAQQLNSAAQMLLDLSEWSLGKDHLQTTAARKLVSTTRPEQVVGAVNAPGSNASKAFNVYVAAQKQALEGFLRSNPRANAESADLRTIVLNALSQIRVYQYQQKIDAVSPLFPKTVQALKQSNSIGSMVMNFIFRGLRFTNLEENESWYVRVNNELLAIKEGVVRDREKKIIKESNLIDHALNLRKLITTGRAEAAQRNIVARYQLNKQLDALEDFVNALDKQQVKTIRYTLIQNMLANGNANAPSVSIDAQKQQLQTALSQHKSATIRGLLADNSQHAARLFNAANTESKLKAATKAISKALLTDRYTRRRNNQG